MDTDGEYSRMNTTSEAGILTRQQRDEMAVMAMVQAAGDVVCPRCWDTGYLGTPVIKNAIGPLAWQLAAVAVDEIPWCSCEIGRAWRERYVAGLQDVTQHQLDVSFERAGIPDRFAGLTFDSIPLEHIKGKEQALAAARQFAATGRVLRPDGKSRPGLAFTGKPGVGKTGILSVAFRACVSRGVPGLWIELYSFFGEIQGEYGKGNGRADDKLREAQRAALLMLDDCGDPDRTESVKQPNGKVETIVRAETDDRRRILWEIIDYRHGHSLPTLVTSNLSRSDFEIQWGQRLAARLWELCWIIPVAGIDLRSVM